MMETPYLTKVSAICGVFYSWISVVLYNTVQGNLSVR
jgi:hypothetical protein